MDIDTHVGGPEWWLTIYPYGGPPEGVILAEEEFYALRIISPPRRCEVIVPGSHRGVRCPNYCEPGEDTCPEHPHRSTNSLDGFW